MPPTGAPAAGAPIDPQHVGNLVRHWVHYDTTLQTLNRQTRQAREAKNYVEDQILGAFRQANLQNPVVQIAGGRLIVGREKHTAPLTFRNLEIYLKQYYRQKPGALDETAAILKFIRAQREVTESPCLRRIGVSTDGLPPSSTP